MGSRYSNLEGDFINQEITKYIDRGEAVSIKKLQSTLRDYYNCNINKLNLEKRCNNMNARFE